MSPSVLCALHFVLLVFYLKMNNSVRDWEELNTVVDKCVQNTRKTCSVSLQVIIFIKDKHEYNCPSVLCYAQNLQLCSFLSGLGSLLLSISGTCDLLVLPLKGMTCQKIRPQCIWNTYLITNTSLSYKTRIIIKYSDIRGWTWAYLNNYHRTGGICGSQQIISDMPELILLAKLEKVMMVSIFSNQLCNYTFIIIIHCVRENISKLPVSAQIIMYNITVHVKVTKISISGWRDYVC